MLAPLSLYNHVPVYPLPSIKPHDLKPCAVISSVELTVVKLAEPSAAARGLKVAGTKYRGSSPLLVRLKPLPSLAAPSIEALAAAFTEEGSLLPSSLAS